MDILHLYKYFVCYVLLFILLSNASYRVISTIIEYKGLQRYRHVCRVLYDGTHFKGWQDQVVDNQRTVQGTLRKHFSQRFKIPMRVTGSSRTDQGVHSHGQAIHFDTPSLFDIGHFEYCMNRMLPNDLKVYNVSIAPIGNADQAIINEPWHATKSAIGKLYSYRFCTNQFVDPIKRNNYAHVYYRIDIAELESLLQCFVGTHNFVAFTNCVESTMKDFETKSAEFSTIKTINSINLYDEGSGYYRVDFNIQSALYRMIRNIMGTALEVANNKYSLEWMLYLLHESSTRSENKSRPAPPHGLCLEHVYYDHY